MRTRKARLARDAHTELDPAVSKELHRARTPITTCATYGSSPNFRLAQVDNRDSILAKRGARQYTNQSSYPIGVGFRIQALMIFARFFHESPGGLMNALPAVLFRQFH